MQKRDFLKMAIFAAISIFLPVATPGYTRSLKDDESENLDFEWAIPVSDVDREKQAFLQHGAQVKDGFRPFAPPPDKQDEYSHSAFQPLVIIAGSVALAYLAERLVFVTKAVKHPGVVVNCRKEKIEVVPAPDIPFGTVVMICDRKTQIFDASNSSDLPGVLKQQIKGAK